MPRRHVAPLLSRESTCVSPPARGGAARPADPKPLLKLVFKQFMGNTSGFVDMVTRHIKSPVANAAAKVRRPRPQHPCAGATWRARFRLLTRPVGGALVSACAALQTAQIYSGDYSGAVFDAMRTCDPAGPLMVNIVKLFPSPDAQTFLAFGRVMSGTLEGGQEVKVLGENYTQDDVEDMAIKNVSAIGVSQVRGRAGC